jgi:bifunctional non-homologous end joining protein LigD
MSFRKSETLSPPGAGEARQYFFTDPGKPMLASLEDPPLCDSRLVYEPKYDGIRALVQVNPGTQPEGVRIWSRLGNEKTEQFPDLVRAINRFRRRLKAPVLLDGEIVAVDASGEPTGFQRLQGRIHLTGLREGSRLGGSGAGGYKREGTGLGRPGPREKELAQASSGRVGGIGAMKRASIDPVALVLFDVLRDGSQDLRGLPWTARRARLERIIGDARGDLRLSEYTVGDGRSLYKKALERGWEGIIAKAAESPYRAGKRSPDWRKLKIIKRQEFVVAGWTEPRNSRACFGALLLGVYEGQALRYVGHTGAGFSGSELQRVDKLLRKIESKHCPFSKSPRTNERPHWCEPRLVAEVKFTEWTADGKLRNPTYLGLRTDVEPLSVHRESSPQLHQVSVSSVHVDPVRSTQTAAPRGSRPKALENLMRQLDEIVEQGGSGQLRFPAGEVLEVGNLNKIFWPACGFTKADLMRYYLRMAPFVLPVIQDRPLVMKRFPNGIKGPAFYQQRAPEEVPPGVRVEVLPDDSEVPSRLVGGSLMTLLYMTQLAVVSRDPWFSRVQSPDFADYVALDLDPMPGLPFTRVLDVARWVGEELHRYSIPNVPKTSGATGLHVYIPLPPKTSYEAGRIFCQLIATIVATRHPGHATVTRMIDARGAKVYIDYLQNIRGKTLACAYSARASDFAGVSTPVSWQEIEQGIAPQDFTIRTVPERVHRLGDQWAVLRASRGVNIQHVVERLTTRRTR